jgi:peptide-methionine (S)-S-oxide reductase
MGDHTESVSIDFDPKQVSYEELLTRFWNSHNAERNHPGRQYRNVIFYRNATQKEAAESSREKAAAELGIDPEQIMTHLVEATLFTYAEKYHQNYILTRSPEIRSFLEEVYPSLKDFADSAVATRLNAWLGSGWEIDREKATEELEAFGLTDSLKNRVLSALA